MKTQFPRLYQIYEESDRFHPGNCLSKLFGDDPFQDDLSLYKYYESLFHNIDEENWESFKSKGAQTLHEIRQDKISGESKEGMADQQVDHFQCFDTFNEVHGYLFLKEKIGCEKVKFLEKAQVKTPDLEGFKGQTHFVLEVKTINTSDDHHAHLKGVKGYEDFTPSFMKLKILFCKVIVVAKKQLDAFPLARKIIFLVIDLDLNCNTPEFREKLCQEIKQDMALVNKDLTICGIFSRAKWRPQNVDIPFNWT